MAENIDRLRDQLPGVQVPRMSGDNLAILLCTHFENPDQEPDETGWSDDAVAGMYETLDAIHAHYSGALSNLTARVAELEAENVGLRAACIHGAVYLEALQSDLIANDVDMMIDTPVSPAAVAADLRAALPEA